MTLQIAVAELIGQTIIELSKNDKRLKLTPQLLMNELTGLNFLHAQKFKK